MCIYDDGDGVFRGKKVKKLLFVMQNLGIWGIMGTGGRKCHIWNRRPCFAYSLCNFYRATMMIKGSFLLSAPIIKHFRSKKNCPVLGQNLTVWGINRGLKLNLSFITPKRHILV